MKIQTRLPLSDRMANHIIDLRGSPENFEKLTNMKFLICGESGPEKAFSMRSFSQLKMKVLNCYLSQVVETKEAMAPRPKHLNMLRFKISNMYWMIGRLLEVNYAKEDYCDYKNEWRKTAKKV